MDKAVKSTSRRWVEEVARKRSQKCLQMLMRVSHRTTQLVRYRRRWYDNIKMDLADIYCGHVDCIKRIYDREKYRDFVTNKRTLSFS